MFQKSKHQWELVGKTYAPPKEALNITDPKTQEKALFGVTTLLWVCALTGETRKEEMIGSDDSQLTTLCEKAEKYGMQYVMNNGKQYALALVPPEENLPLR